MKKDDEWIEILKVTKKRNSYVVQITKAEGILEEEVFSENQLVDYRIFKGQVFSKEEYLNIIAKKSESDLFDKTLYYLSFNAHTEKEIKDYLISHQATYDNAKVVLVRLKNLGLVNDEKYASDFVNNASSNGKGPNYIKSVLRQKGVSEDIINQSLNHYSFDEMIDNIKLIIEKELPKLNSFPISKQKEKLLQKLLRLGFSNGAIHAVLKEFTITSNHEDRLAKEVKNYLRKEEDLLKIKQKLIQKGYSYSEVNQMIKKILEEEL